MKKVLLALLLAACGSETPVDECSTKLFQMRTEWAAPTQGSCGQSGSSLYWISAYNDGSGYKFEPAANDSCTGAFDDDSADFKCLGGTADGYWTYTFTFNTTFEDGVNMIGTGKVKAESVLHDYCEQDFSVTGIVR